jgi:signal transduction histidine kinase
MTRWPAFLRTTTFRFTILAASLFALSAFALLAFVYESTAGVFSRQTDALLARQITEFKTAFEKGGINAVNKIVVEHSTGRDPFLYVFTRPDGKFVSGNLSALPQSILKPGANHRFTYKLYNPVTGAKETHRARGRLIRFPGAYKLLVARDTEEESVLINRISRAVWIAAGLVLALGLISGALISRRFASRLNGLNDVARDVMSGDLKRRAPRNHTGDELDELAANLNAMLSQIEQLLAATRHAGDSIAHDLRSPLTRMRNRLEAQLREGEALSPKEAEAALLRTMDDADELLQTFNSVLRIARLEAGEQREAYSRMDPSALLHDVAEMYGPVAEDAGLTFEAQIEDNLFIRADQGLLAQALSNILDNALKYTPKGGAVALRLRKQRDGKVAISVTDTGPGVPKDQREAIFKRFVRLEASRSQAGSGLGLALVFAVAKAHGAELVVEDGAGDSAKGGPGLHIALVFPMARQRKTKPAETTRKNHNSTP